MPANLARIHVLLGHREQAIDLLITVFSRPGPLSPAWLKVDPFWDPLRSSPRFQQLLATTELGLPDGPCTPSEAASVGPPRRLGMA